MTQGARSAITITALALLLVLAAVWGWSAATEPLPAKVDTPLCSTRSIAKGDKVFPQDVTVSVYNAGTREGLAGRVMQSFIDDGFAEGNSGNTSAGKVDDVAIWTTEPTNPAVLLVASQLGGRVDIERRDGLGAGVTVVVGDDFTALVKGDRREVAADDAQICSPPV
ncbi:MULTISPECIES: LytR C-terminal domain-containing protein [unclassified Nocardioides]|jgi:LytR cell envelope-related transcriptional attenuator|uniref:LytR C-terminal domain-containing protein n=1 Tax=Nocardioides sp. URHA0032 TaxID=1380388 RepID=UPI00049163AA|nr:LytR C-terminal domain-containing protein [Nocardioides sp. URHA0032]